MRIRRTGIALTLAMMLAAPASAAAAWSPPQQLGPGGGAALATDGHGNRAIAWVAGGAVRVAFAHDGGPFRHVRAIPGSEVRAGQGDSEVSVVVRGGRALVAWTFFDDSRPSTGGDSDVGCCSARKAAVVDHGVPRRAAALTDATDPEDLSPGALALDPAGRAAVATNTSGANFAILSRGTRWRRDELPEGPADPLAVYFRHGHAVVTFAGADRRVRDAVRIGPGHFREGRVLFGGTQGVTVVTSARGRQALAASMSGGRLMGALRNPGRSFHQQVLAGVFERPGLAIADSGRALAVWNTSGRFAVARGAFPRGFSAARLVYGASFATPMATSVRADGWGLFLYQSFVRDGPQPLVARFVSPSGRVGPASQVSAAGSPPASAIDSFGAVAAWQGQTSLLVSRSPVPGRR